MEDFDLMYMLKTPLFMGSAAQVITESETLELNADDAQNQTLKSLIVVRALSLDCQFEKLKAFLQNLMQGDQKVHV